VARALKRRFIGTEYSADLAKAAFERMTVLGPATELTGAVTSSAIFQPRQASAKAKARTLASLGESFDAGKKPGSTKGGAVKSGAARKAGGRAAGKVKPR
jgi:hypothetical protein